MLTLRNFEWNFDKYLLAAIMKSAMLKYYTVSLLIDWK